MHPGDPATPVLGRGVLSDGQVAEARSLVRRLGLLPVGDAAPFALAMQPFAATILARLEQPAEGSVLVHEALSLEYSRMPVPDTELTIAGTCQSSAGVTLFELKASDDFGRAIGLTARIRTAPASFLQRSGTRNPGGPSATASVEIEDGLLADYARLSGDANPIHLDRGYVRRLGLPGLVVHGTLLAFLVEPALKAAGIGGVPRRLNMRFLAPAYAGELLDLLVSADPHGGAARARVTISVAGGPISAVADVALGA